VLYFENISGDPALEGWKTGLSDLLITGLSQSSDQVAADAGPGIEKVTTSSPKALKYYLESLRAFRTLDGEKVIALCEKAVEIDPQFASAYLMLAVVYEGRGNNSKGRELRKKAFYLRDRLPARTLFGGSELLPYGARENDGKAPGGLCEILRARATVRRTQAKIV
jgi:tetratricopeptide (TPR) repeat protein